MGGIDWVYDKLQSIGHVTIKSTFTFVESDIHVSVDNDIEDQDSITFVLGNIEGEYYKIKGDKLAMDVDVYIHSKINISPRMFTAYRGISVFRKINRVVKEDIYIGFDDDVLPYVEFEKLLASFPNSTELTKYSLARISSVVREYFDNTVDAESDYEQYLNKRIRSKKTDGLVTYFAHYEYEKYRLVLDKLNKMLDSETTFRERTWQHEILGIIQLIYPKYIKVFEEVTIRDVYNQRNKRLDYMLVDSSGNIDIVEIKKPFEKSIVSQSKYRGNYVPLRELSGTVMQIEKYIYLLNKWGKRGEETLSKKYKDDLPDGLKINVINPGALIIMGRENKLTPAQLKDFEVIKRKYKNVIDIITYDELIARLKHIIFKFEHTGK